MKTKHLITSAFCLVTSYISFAQCDWHQKASFGGTARYCAAGFSIGTKGYIGTGYDGARTRDFWEWDQATNVWTQKADFGGTARYLATGFSIGTKGYIGTGFDGVSATQDFWEWDGDTVSLTYNTWTQKANFGGVARASATGFSIGTKGYIGIGGGGPYEQDFWEYNPTTDAWTKKADFGGNGRQNAVGFSIGNKGYVGAGEDMGTKQYDFWEYDQSTDTWTAKAAFGGTATGGAVGFSIGTKGYIGTGYQSGGGVNDFWEWNQGTNVWTKKASFGGTARYLAVGFSIGTKGYIGTGQDSLNTNVYRNDFWEYDPSLNIILTTSMQNVSCNQGSNGSAAAVISGSTPPYTYQWSSGQSTFAITGLTAGNYNVTVNNNGNSCTKTATVTITQPTAIAIGITPTNTPCGYSGSASATVSGGTSPYIYVWSSGQSASTATGLAAGNYTLMVTDTNSCIATQTVSIANNLPPAPSICLATVDSLSQYNLIVWEKQPNEPIDSFIIYREISLNNYQPIGAVPYSALSLFADTVRAKYFPNTGDPNGGTYRYKIQVRDTCGNYSALSPYHNTIFMTSNNSGTFSWPFYTIESSPNPVSTYVLMRDDLNNGNWNAINSVSGSQQTVTDPAYSTWAATANWRITTQWNITCTPTLKNSVPMTTINATLSNTFKTGGNPGVNSLSIDESISIYPSVNDGEFSVHGLYFPMEITVADILGEKVYASTLNRNKETVNISSQPNGIYFLQFKTDQGTAAKKIIIQE